MKTLIGRAPNLDTTKTGRSLLTLTEALSEAAVIVDVDPDRIQEGLGAGLDNA